MKKKERSTLVVILTILFLSCFIVLPPLFRSMFTEYAIPDTVISELAVLHCEQEVTSEQLNVVARVIYANGDFRDTTLIFTHLEEILEIEDEVTTYSAREELEAFRNMSDISIVEDEQRVEIRLNATHLNHESEVIRNHIGEINSQRSRYESLGFTCRIES